MRISLQDELLCLFDIHHFSDNFFKKSIGCFSETKLQKWCKSKQQNILLKKCFKWPCTDYWYWCFWEVNVLYYFVPSNDKSPIKWILGFYQWTWSLTNLGPWSFLKSTCCFYIWSSSNDMAKEKQERLTDQNNPPLYDIRDIKNNWITLVLQRTWYTPNWQPSPQNPLAHSSRGHRPVFLSQTRFL